MGDALAFRQRCYWPDCAPLYNFGKLKVSYNFSRHLVQAMDVSGNWKYLGFSRKEIKHTNSVLAATKWKRQIRSSRLCVTLGLLLCEAKFTHHRNAIFFGIRKIHYFKL